MIKTRNILFLIFIFVVGWSQVCAQKFIRLDKANFPDSKKFFIGEDFHYITSEYPDVWRHETISDLDFDSQAIIFHNDLLTINQIKKVRTYSPWAHSLGVNLYRFSAAWFVFGGIADATTEYKVGADTAIIGGSALLLGLVFDKLMFKKTHKLGNRWKIRILDTNF